MKRRLQDAFDQIHAEQKLKDRTMKFLDNAVNEYSKRRVTSFKRLMAAVACLVLLLSVGIGYSAYQTPACAISIDINPSIELGINCLNKVVSVNTYNEDGYALMSDIDVDYLDYNDALKRILTDRDMKKYIAQDQLIVITVFGKNEAKNNEMLDNVVHCTNCYANVYCSSGNSKEVAVAHEAGMSFGKYKAFLELQALDPDITIEDIQELTMCQIWDMIDERSNNNIDETNQNDSTDRCGKGRNVGQGLGRGRGRRLHQQENSGN